MTIGQRMRSRRIELNINPKDIAEKIGKSVSTYYRYETGEIEKLTISKMCEIAEHLKVSPVFLLLGLEPDTQYNLSKKVDINNHMILDFSKNLKKLRVTRNLTCSDLADKLNNNYQLNLSVNDIEDWENGIQSPDVVSFIYISEFFKVSVDYLLGRNIKEVKYSTNYSPKYNSKVSEPTTKYDEEDFAVRNLRNILLTCDLPLENIAERTKISIDRLNGYIHGTIYKADIDELKAISIILNIPLIDMMYERDDTALLEKISHLNAVQIKILEDYVDRMLKD